MPLPYSSLSEIGKEMLRIQRRKLSIISLSQGPYHCFVPSQDLWLIGIHSASVVACAKACNVPGGLSNLFLTILMESF